MPRAGISIAWRQITPSPPILFTTHFVVRKGVAGGAVRRTPCCSVLFTLAQRSPRGCYHWEGWPPPRAPGGHPWSIYSPRGARGFRLPVQTSQSAVHHRFVNNRIAYRVTNPKNRIRFCLGIFSHLHYLYAKLSLCECIDGRLASLNHILITPVSRAQTRLVVC